MTLTLSLPAVLEARLHEQAAATGKDVSTLVREAVEEKFAAAPTDPNDLPYDQWLKRFNEWIASHKPVNHFVDDSRESIYAGRGE